MIGTLTESYVALIYRIVLSGALEAVTLISAECFLNRCRTEYYPNEPVFSANGEQMNKYCGIFYVCQFTIGCGAQET